MADYTFSGRLKFSKNTRSRTDIECIKEMIHGCISVTPAGLELDRNGIDYVATLRRGREIYIDAKARSKGCSKYWNNGPEIALEIWSKKPNNGSGGHVGWTLDESKQTELVLFTFHESDCDTAYLFSHQLLRIALIEKFDEWTKKYKLGQQRTIGGNGKAQWESECVFVPVDVVFDAVKEASILDRGLKWTQKKF